MSVFILLHTPNSFPFTLTPLPYFSHFPVRGRPGSLSPGDVTHLRSLGVESTRTFRHLSVVHPDPFHHILANSNNPGFPCFTRSIHGPKDI